ncbi:MULTISPECIES: plasmid mobilization relaxosome protein MobC [Gordonia]|jgi:hypothetical protein|uniref:Bacterial mobilisation domain-containing protein n=1 Tax=Gordonia sihwensis NBRC 108236 TaxID=1223544 RepID=L7LQG0_9ACTN|nr:MULTISPECIES: plasmid mobilization relaxosome protein MobC [Gordonia]AUH70532.1 plasmid mobilization relaxosome protein MobC [Gordonia sp. YC-JH1]AUH70596.1 plasmid mobilization relaxosome protein MobC [Gordonia sp. YC-JH1]WFN95111.1 plasmid mobilization relaxosome protein MobC [Gordonia sihwensis]GAC62328.1 hypothetical protein GSI01S_33_00140 [Gordonia sihwensis NBRC 108236]
MNEQDPNASRAFLRRRRRNVVGGRTNKIEVKVTAVEQQRLRAAADDAGVSVQRLMVARTLSPVAAVPVGREEKVAAWQQAVDMRNLIAGIGVNLNQIARQANSEAEIPAEFAAACAGVDRALSRITAAFNEVFNDPSTRIGE